MTSMSLAVIALILTALPVILLCVGDPKRRRAARQDGGDALRRRRLLLAAACLPGLGCAALGDSAAFMLWLGGTVLLGWAMAAALAGRRDPTRPRERQSRTPTSDAGVSSGMTTTRS